MVLDLCTNLVRACCIALRSLLRRIAVECVSLLSGLVPVFVTLFGCHATRWTAFPSACRVQWRRVTTCGLRTAKRRGSLALSLARFVLAAVVMTRRGSRNLFAFDTHVAA